MKKRPLNVLFINHSVRDGGPGRSLFYILKYLNRERVNPFVLIPKDDIFSENLKREGKYQNIIIESRFPENIFRPRLGLDVFTGKSDNLDLVTKIKKFACAVINIFELVLLVFTSSKHIRPDQISVIHCNGTVAKVVGFFIGKYNNVPVVWHVRNIQQTFILKKIISTLARLDPVKKIICVSNATALQFDKVKEKVHVVYNGIDPDDYSSVKAKGQVRKELGIDDHTVVIGSTGRLVPRKGYENLIKAAQQVKDMVQGTDYKFVVVGDTPHFFQYDHLKYLKKKVEESGLKDRFIFTGYRDDIRPYLNNFDLFVIPSNYPDPFPRAVIEAMSCGLPVVGFEIGGIAEAVEKGVTGYLSNKGDVSDMARNIATLIADGDLRRKMGEDSLKRVASMCSASDRTQDIENIILSVG